MQLLCPCTSSFTIYNTKHTVCSLPSCCSPKTGRRLRFGPAMRERTKHVELPGLAALFADIASPAPTRPWDLNTEGANNAPSRSPTPLVIPPLNWLGGS